MLSHPTCQTEVEFLSHRQYTTRCRILTLCHFHVKQQEMSSVFIILRALFKTEQYQRDSPWISPSASLGAAQLMQQDCKSQPHNITPTAEQHSLKSYGTPLKSNSTTHQV